MTQSIIWITLVDQSGLHKNDGNHQYVSYPPVTCSGASFFVWDQYFHQLAGVGRPDLQDFGCGNSQVTASIFAGGMRPPASTLLCFSTATAGLMNVLPGDERHHFEYAVGVCLIWFQPQRESRPIGPVTLSKVRPAPQALRTAWLHCLKWFNNISPILNCHWLRFSIDSN